MDRSILDGYDPQGFYCEMLASPTCAAVRERLSRLSVEALKERTAANSELYVPESRRGSKLGGGATHAWLEIYLLAAGWIEFDPTNSILGGADLIRVAVVHGAAPHDPEVLSRASG